MKSLRSSRFFVVLSVCCLLVCVLFAWLLLPREQDAAAKTVSKSWQLMQAVGQYDFSTTIEQIAYPAPALANVGQSSKKETYQLTGQADLHNNSLAVRLFQNQGSLLNQAEGVEIRLQNGKASGRVIGAEEWEPLDTFTSASNSFGNNGMLFLTAAKNIREQGEKTIQLPNFDGETQAVRVTAYRFDVDSEQYSEAMRDLMVEELQRSGQLPMGMNLSVSDVYRQMVSSGEVWLNEDGLPVRLIVTMKLPPEENGDHVESTITTDYYNYHTGNLLAARSFPYQIAGALGLPTSARAARELLAQVSLAAGCVLLVLLATMYSNKRIVYGAVAVLTILSLLVSPIWQSSKAAAFVVDLEARNASTKAEQEAARNQQQAGAGTLTTWDPHTSPFEKAGANALAAVNAVAPASSGDQNRVSPASLAAFNGLTAAQNLAAQADDSDESDVDTDRDGLTDAYEAEYGPDILNPLKADTDDDGLPDNVELQLNLFPGQADTDKDGILDYDEVRPFYYGDKDWYTNPEERDTDQDGLTDGVECPQRMNGASDGVCQDTDGDLIPDVFDTDDDNDGIPTIFDESPYFVSGETFTLDSPLRLTINHLANRPVFVNYQIVPTNPKHLTYALNVLDWPSGDTDGQIQRISDTTFADHLTASQAVNDSKAQFGDMRLIPMAEIKLTGDSYPLPLSRSVSVNIATEGYSGSLELSSKEDNPGKTEIKLTEGPVAPSKLHLGQGDCDDVKRISSLGLNAPGDSAVVEKSLGDLVSGDYVFYITSADGSSITSCSSIPATAHGKLSEYVIDSTTLQAYGGAARDDGEGNVLLYIPLSVVYDEAGGHPVAFSSKVPFTNLHNGFDQSQQEVRLIWMLNMLVDECKGMPADYNESKNGSWCDPKIPERWNKDISRVVHTYTDEFRLAGLSVVEDHGVEMAVIFENPATDSEPDYDDPLWGVAGGLERSFLAGRSKDGQRDMTVDEIFRRFEPSENSGTTEQERWGFANDTFRVLRYSYDNADGVSAFITGQVTNLFNSYFNTIPEADRPTQATLLFAREATQRATSIGEPSASCSGGSCVVDFSGLDEITQAILNWSPYQRSGDQWQPYDLDDYLDRLEAHLRNLDSYQPEDDSVDAKNYANGMIAMAKIYYQSLASGIASLIAVNGHPIISPEGVASDEVIFDDYYRNNTKGQIVAKLISFAVNTILDGFRNNGRLLFMVIFGTKTDAFRGIIKALGEGFAQKVSPITKLLTTTLRKAAFGIAAFVVLAAVAISMILYLAGDTSIAGKVGGRIMFAAFGTLSVVLGGTALMSAIKSIKCVSDSAKTAAIIGAVISGIIAWGVFIYTWAASGVSFGSVAFNNMLADAIAATATIVLMAALSATGVGAIVVAVITLIDGLISTICAIAGAHEQETDHWARQYVCIGISGWVTKVFKWVFYSNTYLIDYTNGDRLSFHGVDQSLQNASAGMSYGNNMQITLQVKNTIKKSSVPIDWKAAAYFWQYSDANAKSSTFSYTLQSKEKDIHDGLNRGDIEDQWKSVGGSKWEQDFTASTDGYSIPLPKAGINQDPVVYISEGSAVPVQECWAIFIPIVTPVPIPVCYIRTERATVSSNISSSLTVDVFPASLDEFYTLAGDSAAPGGYRLAWANFPVLKDADGDGLMSKAFPGGSDPDDSLFDTDGDGLSDFAEAAFGTNPRMVDTDDDGLDDDIEIRYGTSPTRKDTDGDGLSDAEELAGWLYTYGFTPTGEPLETMVYSDPLLPDTDLDGVTDYLEKVYGFNPRVPQDSDVLDYQLAMRELDSPTVLLRLNESSGAMSFEDSSNFGFSASCTAGECPVAGIDGRYGAAARFEGSDLLRLPSSAGAISISDNRPFTIAGWVNAYSGGTVLSKWSDAPGARKELRFEITGSGHLRLISPSAEATSSVSVPFEQWTFVAASFNGSQVTFLINGNLAGTSSFSTPATDKSSTPVEFMLGAYQGSSGPTGYFSGGLDEIAYFDQALSSVDLAERWMAARYNLNDSYVRPGEEIVYQSTITNRLNSRFAYGLLTTIIDKTSAIVNWASRLLPTTFVLYPDNPALTTGGNPRNIAVIQTQLQIASDHSTSEDVTITQTAAAQIVDRRAESNLAELWLPLDEVQGATTFVDQSGNMPPRDSTCGGSCPSSGQDGILNKAVLFKSGGSSRINLPDLKTLNLLNRGYTISMWVKPVSTATSGARIPLLQSSPADRLSITLVRQGDGSYLPEVRVNGQNKVNSSWRTMKASVWSHLVVEYSTVDQKLKVFINGGQIASVDADALTCDSDSTCSLWLGGASTPADFYVDDLRIFSRPLTMTDINRLAERPVLELNMDSSSFSDASTYGQTVSFPYKKPSLNSESVRGSSLKPGSGSSLGFLEVRGNSLLDLSDGSFTISAWVYPTAQSHPTWQGIFGNRENPSRAYPTLERQGNKLRFGFGDGSGYRSYTTGDVLTQSTWNQVTITFAPSPLKPGEYTFKLYINSRLVESTNFTSKPASSTNFYVGVSTVSYTTHLYTLYMDNEHDAGSKAEPYIELYINDKYIEDALGEQSMSDGSSKEINYSKKLSGFEEIRFEVWEEDSTSNDDFCGEFTRHWYDLPDTAVQTLDLSNGFDGRLTYQMTRESIQFYGLIDELDIYRYAIDSEQVYDQYYSIPVTAVMPLDDRPSSSTFENRAVIGSIDDGTCTGANCPAAGTIGLINQAVRFDGIDDVISIPVSTTPEYMVSLWLNAACEDCGVYSLHNGASVYHQIYMKGGRVCSLAGSREMCSQSTTVADGQWHYVVYTNDGRTADLWLDGEKVNTITGAGAVASPGTKAQLGYAPAAQNASFDGQIDDARVFRYVQDAAAISAIKQRAPLFLGRLDEPDGSEIFDDATPNDYQLGCTGESCPDAGKEGRLRSAVEFTQNVDALVLNQPALSTGAQAFTVSLWIYPTQVKDTAQTIFTIANGNNTQPRYSVSIAPGSLVLNVQGSDQPSGSIPQSNVELIKNTWNMITLVVEPGASGSGEMVYLYINGYLDSSWAMASSGTGLGKLYLGNAAGFSGIQSGPYSGRMDEVSVYTYALNEIQIRETFAYQMGQVEETASLTMTIDADLPQAALLSYNPDFPYTDENDRILQVEASDATSGIGMVEMQVDHVDAPSTQWVTAPACLDAPGGTAYCPTFIPKYGDGIYNLTFRAVDQVGHQTVTQSYALLVDNTAPKIFSNLQDGSLYPAQAHPSLKNTWFLHMEGQVIDETLSQGSPGSGLDLTSMKVTVYSENGEIAGGGSQTPELTPAANGYNWNLDFLFPEGEPTGALTVTIEVKDRVGNRGVKTVTILLDATAPDAKMESNQVQPQDALSLMDASTLDSKLISGGTISGSVNDTPPDGAPYMTANGKRAASGVERVEAAFEPSLGVSYLFNEPYPEGLLAWLPLDNAKPPEDKTGTPDESASERYFLDISPAQFAGRCSGDACPINGETGHKNGSIYFDGQGKSINLGSNVDLSNRSFSVLIWARRDSAGRSDPFLWQGPLSMAGQRFLFGLDYENHVVCGFGGTDLLSAGTYADTEWHAYACTYDAASRRRAIYRDGQLIASDTAAPIPVMNEDLIIGSAPVGSFAGSLDELMILDRALTGDQIREAYTGYQTVYHLAVEEPFLAHGDAVMDKSGYFHRGVLDTGDGDLTNKVTAGAVGDYALHFDGNDRLAVEPSFSLQLDRGAFTQTAWIRPEAGPARGGIISQDDENPEQRYPSIYVTDQFGLAAGFGDLYNWNELTTGPNVVKQGEWNFIAARFDGDTYSLLVNGKVVAQTSAMKGKTPYPANRFYIGDSFAGSIDDVKIYTRPLADIEITAMARAGWRSAALDSSTWTAQVMPGLEGPYRVDVRGWDTFGHYSTGWDVNHQWSGVVDTLSPRFSFSRVIDKDDPNIAHYTFSVEDFQLDERSIRQNLCSEMKVTREYFNSSWYLATGIPPNTTLYRLSGECSGDIRSRETLGFYACDLAGNCVMQEYPPTITYDYTLYLPVIVNSSATGVASLAPESVPQITAEQAERAMQWPVLAGTSGETDGGQAPSVEILTSELTPADARTMFHTNIRGLVSDDSRIARVQVEVIQNGATIYTTDAPVYGGAWNAIWIYPPGGQPANGTYTVRATAFDEAGNQAAVERDIHVHLLP